MICLLPQLWKMLEDTRSDMYQKELLAASEGVLSHPKKESYVTLLLRNHDRLKASVDDLMKSITSGTLGVHQIINQLSVGRVSVIKGNRLFLQFGITLCQG